MFRDSGSVRDCVFALRESGEWRTDHNAGVVDMLQLTTAVQKLDNGWCKIAHTVAPYRGIRGQHQFIVIDGGDLNVFQQRLVEKLAEQSIQVLQGQHFVSEPGQD